MTDTAIINHLETLTRAVIALTQQQGARLTRAELCTRLGIHRNTITAWLETDRHFPRPDKSGKWLLSDIVRWELSQTTAPSLRPALPPKG